MPTFAPPESVKDLLQRLRHDRDELRLQMHLAKLEIQADWSRLERKWTEVDDRLRPTREAAAKSGQNIWESVKLVADEIASGYRRIHDSLKN